MYTEDDLVNWFQESRKRQEGLLSQKRELINKINIRDSKINIFDDRIKFLKKTIGIKKLMMDIIVNANFYFKHDKRKTIIIPPTLRFLINLLVSNGENYKEGAISSEGLKVEIDSLESEIEELEFRSNLERQKWYELYDELLPLESELKKVLDEVKTSGDMISRLPKPPFFEKSISSKTV